MVVFACASDSALVFQIGAIPNLRPILLANIIVNFDLAGIEPITAILLAAGDPVMLVSLNIVVVGFVAAFQRPKPLVLVINRAASLGKTYAPNPRSAREAIALVFDVHDVRLSLHVANVVPRFRLEL